MIKVTSLNEYLSIIESYEDNLQDNEENKNLYFRGEAKKCWDLKPSIFREEKYLEIENKLFLDMQRYLYSEFKDFSTTLDKLVYMQHHGLPTRLLDITSNPLVSLYFACEKNIGCKNLCECSTLSCKDKKCDDGIVYIFPQYDKVDEEKASVVSLLAKLDKNFEKSDIDKLIHEELNTTFENVIIEDYLKSSEIFIKTNRNNNRQINQDGDFLLFANNNKENKKLSYFLDKKHREYEPIIIDKNSKESILKELDRIGINIFTLFPEAEKLSQYLVQKHTKNKIENFEYNIVSDEIKKEDNETQVETVVYNAKDLKALQSKGMNQIAKSCIINYLKSKNIWNNDIRNFIDKDNIFDEKYRRYLLEMILKEAGIEEMDKFEDYILYLREPKNLIEELKRAET